MDTNHDDALPPATWSMLEFSFSPKHEDARMVAMCNGRRVVIDLDSKYFSASPSLLEQYRFLLQVADNFEPDDYTEEDFYDWIAEPLLPVFHQLSMLESVGSSLEDFFKPETQYYTLQAQGNSLIAVERQDMDDMNNDVPIFGVPMAEGLVASFPWLRPSEVQPCNECDRSATGVRHLHPSRLRFGSQMEQLLS